MIADDMDQLAEDWESALEEQAEAEAEVAYDEDYGSLDDAEYAQDGDYDAGEEISADDQNLADEWAAALTESEAEDMRDEHMQEQLAAQSSPAQFKNMTQQHKAQRTEEGQRRDIDFILDIPLDVSAELGRTKLLINELLQLGQGSVIELNKLAGEPLEVYVNGKMVARGEAVVINEKFGVRLTDIVSHIERVKQLG